MTPPKFGAANFDDDGERLAKLEERMFNLETNLDLRVQLAVEKLRTEMAKKSGRSEIMEWLVFGVAGLVLLGFFGAVVAYFQGRPIGSPIRINTEGAK